MRKFQLRWAIGVRYTMVAPKVHEALGGIVNVLFLFVIFLLLVAVIMVST